ncbi:MAG: hypothetical protein Q4B06_02225 [Candidatus Saccharibacteria bacterium]|nr:hypothetical protein [Candidatus Saccharibacteria bacterium]
MNELQTNVRELFKYIDCKNIDKIIASGDPIGFGYDNRLVCIYLKKQDSGYDVKIELFNARRFLFLTQIDWSKKEILQFSTRSVGKKSTGNITNDLPKALSDANKSFQEAILRSKENVTLSLGDQQVACIPFMENKTIFWNIRVN